MSDLSQVLSEGTMLIVETGEYSDGSWAGPLRMLVSKTKAELAEQFVREWTPDEMSWGADAPSPRDFVPWLIRAGIAEDVACTAWHVGSYGEFEP